jgi:hypothetical protein
MAKAVLFRLLVPVLKIAQALLCIVTVIDDEKFPAIGFRIHVLMY